jgi:hypothetical protein
MIRKIIGGIRDALIAGGLIGAFVSVAMWVTSGR